MISITAELIRGAIRANATDPVAGPRDHNTIEWPPSPARLFAALVAGGGSAGNNRIGTNDAELRALESAPPPLIAASSANDVSETRLEDRYVVLDSREKNRVHEYAARTSGMVRPGGRASPKSRYITYVWPELDLDDEVVRNLRQRAARVSYLGCADSPVRLMVNASTPRDGREIWHPDDDGDASIAVPYPGYLGALDRQFQAFQAGASPRAARLPRTRVGYRTPGERRPTHNATAPTIWLQFDRPFNARRVLQVGEAVRNAVLSMFDELGFGEAPPLLHGHRIPKGEQHARFFPLPNLGHRHGKGQLMGVAIRLPMETDRDLVGMVEVAAASVQRISLPGGFSRAVRLRDPGAQRPWTTNRRRWVQPATLFASASPVVHERFGRVTSTNERDTVAAWCENAGLPKPVAARVRRAPYIEGVPNFSSGDLWRDGSTQGYPFSHVAVLFGEPVVGPVAIGRGRTFGLGLLVPIESDQADKGIDALVEEDESSDRPTDD